MHTQSNPCAITLAVDDRGEEKTKIEKSGLSGLQWQSLLSQPVS